MELGRRSEHHTLGPGDWTVSNDKLDVTQTQGGEGRRLSEVCGVCRRQPIQSTMIKSQVQIKIACLPVCPPTPFYKSDNEKKKECTAAEIRREWGKWESMHCWQSIMIALARTCTLLQPIGDKRKTHTGPSSPEKKVFD